MELIADGFPGQRRRVLSPPLKQAALRRAITDRLLVTDVGHYPHAAEHGRSRPHGSSELIVILCVQGSGLVEMGGMTHLIAAADAICIPAGTPHLYRANGTDPWSIWWMHIAGKDAPAFASVIAASGSDPVVRLRDPSAAVSRIESAVLAMQGGETTSSLYLASGAANALLSQIASDRLRGPVATADRIQIVQDYLQQNLTTTASVAMLSELAGLSPSHFSVLFRQATGTSVVAYLRDLRCARARELLQPTDVSIGWVSGEVGYIDPLYFSRQFRRVNGISPQRYRQQARVHDLPRVTESAK